jgi:hypothetical protein
MYSVIAWLLTARGSHCPELLQGLAQGRLCARGGQACRPPDLVRRLNRNRGTKRFVRQVHRPSAALPATPRLRCNQHHGHARARARTAGTRLPAAQARRGPRAALSMRERSWAVLFAILRLPKGRPHRATDVGWPERLPLAATDKSSRYRRSPATTSEDLPRTGQDECDVPPKRAASDWPCRWALKYVVVGCVCTSASTCSCFSRHMSHSLENPPR